MGRILIHLQLLQHVGGMTPPLLHHHRVPDYLLLDDNQQTTIPVETIFTDVVGRVLYNLLKVFGLGFGASETELQVQFWAISRIYYPEKYIHYQTIMTEEYATMIFQFWNNVHSHLRDVL